MSENKKVNILSILFHDSLSNDSFERLAIPPEAHEMILTDINKKGLKEIGDQEGIVNLSRAVFPRWL
uniref:Uncharacterized protein n=1 Tax=Heterorhabditis bacteriophora TaxID=37862 RepID=A0A1I7XKC6_HETBA